MEFRQYIEEYLAQRGNDDPLFVTTPEGQNLLDLSRSNDMDSRPDVAKTATEDSTENTDVTNQAQGEPRLTQTSEPPMESGTLIPDEEISESALPSELQQTEPVDLQLGEQDLRVSSPSGTPSAEPAPAQDLVSDGAAPEQQPQSNGEQAEAATPSMFAADQAVPADLTTSEAESTQPEQPQSAVTEQAAPSDLVTSETEQAQPQPSESLTSDPAAPADLIQENAEQASPADAPSGSVPEPLTPSELTETSSDPVTPSTITQTSTAPAEPSPVPPEALYLNPDAQPVPEADRSPQAESSPLVQQDGGRARVSEYVIPQGMEAVMSDLFMRAETTIAEVDDHHKKIFSDIMSTGEVALPPLIEIPDRVKQAYDPSFSITSGLREWARW